MTCINMTLQSRSGEEGESETLSNSWNNMEYVLTT